MSPIGKDSEDDGLWLWRKTRLIRFSARTFFNALPLFVLWLMIPFVLLVSNSLYQSGRLSSERGDQAQREYPFNFIGENSENLTLHLSYPQKLRIDTDQPYDDTVTVWLTRTMPDASDFNDGEVPETYTFSLAFKRDVADFVDEKGGTIPGIVTLAPVSGKDTAVTLYLKSNPASLKNGTGITIILDQYPPLGNAKEVFIPVEAPSESRWRHFWDAVFSLPILIGGLLTAIAGFGMQQWKVLNDEEQRYKVGQEEATYNRLQEFLKKENYQHAFEIYQEYIREVETPNPRIKALFDDYLLPQNIKNEIEEELHNFDFQAAIELYLKHSTAKVMGFENLWNDVLILFCNNLLAKGKFDAFLQLCSLLDSRSVLPLKIWNDALFQFCNNLLATDKFDSFLELRGLLENHPLLSSKLPSKIRKLWAYRENYLHYGRGMYSISKLRQLLRPWPEIVVYEGLASIQEPSDVKKGMDFLGITHNPFGSEKAEEDFLFAKQVDFIDQEVDDVFPLSAAIGSDEAQLIMGERGAGKTALALFMAGKSFSRGEKTSLDKTFPIYSKIYPHDTADIFLRHFAEILLNYYVKNPGEFLAQDVAHQSALAALLSNYMAGLGELMFRLQFAVLTDESDSVDFQHRLIELAKSAEIVKLTQKDSARFLLQACPLEYQQLLFLFDYQDASLNLSEDFGNIVSLIRELQYGRGVVIKVFSAPSEFSNAVSDRLQFPIVDIDWSFDQLKEVLRARMEESKVLGLGFWFDVGIRSFSQELLIKSSGGTPGGLIRKGNEILRIIGKNKRTLNLKDAKQIFGLALVKKVLKES